jgi:hypothetical protein
MIHPGSKLAGNDRPNNGPMQRLDMHDWKERPAAGETTEERLG